MAKKKKIKSHVKRVKLYQAQHPVSQKKYKQKLRIARRKDFFRRFWKLVGVCIVALLLLFAAGNYMLYQKTGETLFSCAKEAKEIVEASSEADFKLAETTYIYSADGTQIATLAEEDDATFLEYEDIPANVVNAFIAVEDRTFWTNSGVSYKGILRVCVNYVKTGGEVAEGASTITQQLARGVFLSNEKTMLRKIKEIFIARELTKKYTKEQIMAFYCNTCCFANGIYGVEDASKKYFGKSVEDLTLSEVAYLCAIPNRPEYYNPLKYPENALTRRDKILEDMQECGFISATACANAMAQSLSVAEQEEETTFYNYEVTYAINCAVRYLMKADGFEFQYTFASTEEYEEYYATYDEYYAQAKHKLYTGGYKVYTTIDLEAQSALQEILDAQLAFSTDVTDSGIYELQGAMTVIDNDSGKVVAIIGGRSQEENSNIYSLNRAYQSYAQPGSSFKPLVVYTPALESGYTATSLLTNIDVTTAKTSNSEEIAKMSGTQMTLRAAVEASKNGCAYWLFNALTPKVGLSYVTNMHFTKIVADDYTLSAALGGLTYGVTTVEMANAYSTLENHGAYTQTDCIAAMYDTNGNNIYEGYETTSVYTSAAADAMTDVLKGVLTSGTASKASWYNYTSTEAAGKTGTTNDNKAGWFCGYTPYYTIAVWVGCDTPKEVSSLQGASYPLYIWRSAMLYMIDGLSTKTFDLEDTYLYDTTVIEDEEEEEEEIEEELEEETLDGEIEVETKEETTPADTSTTTKKEESISGTTDSSQSTATDSSESIQGSTGTAGQDTAEEGDATAGDDSAEQAGEETQTE